MSDSGDSASMGGREPSAPAGWYPVDDRQQRYWDGVTWTDHIAPLDRPPEAPRPASDPFAGDDPFTADPIAGTDPFTTDPFSGGDPRVGPATGSSPGDPVPFSPATAPAVTAITNDDRNLAVLIHLLSIVSSFLAPLIIWLLKKDQSAFIDHHGKEALNFHITLAIAWVFAFLSIFIVVGILLIPLLFIATFLFPILAAVGASQGRFWRYPLTIRFLR